MILKRNRHEHPLLYMKGISLSNLTCVLDFMYHGEVNVAQDDLNSFLAVAEELKVKGLTQKNDPETKSRQHTVAEKTRQHSQPKPSSAKPSPYNEDDDIEEVLPIKTEPAPSSAAETGVVASSQIYGEEEEYAHYYEESEAGYSEEIDEDGSKGELSEVIIDSCIMHMCLSAYLLMIGFNIYQMLLWKIGKSNSLLPKNICLIWPIFPEEFDAELDTMMYKDTDSGSGLWAGRVVWACGQEGCGRKSRKKSHMRMHVETHLEGVKHKCHICLTDFKTRSSLNSHIWKYHKQDKIA